MLNTRPTRSWQNGFWTGGGLCFALCVLILVAGTPLLAQKAETGRKLLYKVQAKYPDALKKHAIGGVVRLSIVISAKGSVEKISPVGGNPILVDAATVAVKQWKYATADTSTTTEVQFDFVPPQ